MDFERFVLCAGLFTTLLIGLSVLSLLPSIVMVDELSGDWRWSRISVRRRIWDLGGSRPSTVAPRRLRHLKVALARVGGGDDAEG